MSLTEEEIQAKREATLANIERWTKEHGWRWKPKKEAPPCPYTLEDYANWDFESRCGVKGGNGRRLTRGLFYESQRFCTVEPTYTMKEYSVWCQEYGKWLPSAHAIYILSADEYEAMLKLVGSADQWNNLQKLAWFRDGGQDFSGLNSWRAEMDMRKRSQAEGALWSSVRAGNVTAAKTLFDAYNKGAKGRPLKPKEVEDTGEATQDDLERLSKVVNLHRN